MTSFATTSRTYARCRAVAVLGPAELDVVTAMSADAHPDGGPLRCELVAGHDGTHVALIAVANGGDQWWWMRWDDPAGGVEMVQMDPCAAELSEGRYADDCFLPDGHPGPHSFDLPPPASGAG